MFYNLLHNRNLPYIHPIIPAHEGLSDLAFELGWRIDVVLNNKYCLEQIALRSSKDEIVDFEEFQQILHQSTDLDMTHSLKSRSQPICTEKYDRGPYSKYTKGR